MEEEEDNQKAREKELKLVPNLKGVFHTARVCFIREFRSYPWILTCGEDGKVCLLSLEEGRIFTNFEISEVITAADLNDAENLLVVGTANGVVRAFDFTNPRKPFLVGTIRLFKAGKDRPISRLLFSPDQMQVAVSSANSKKVFYISTATNPADFLNLLCFNEMMAKVNDIAWNRGSPANQKLLVLLNFIVLLVKAPVKSSDELRVKPDTQGRKIDPYMRHIVSLESG